MNELELVVTGQNKAGPALTAATQDAQKFGQGAEQASNKAQAAMRDLDTKVSASARRVAELGQEYIKTGSQAEKAKLHEERMILRALKAIEREQRAVVQAAEKAEAAGRKVGDGFEDGARKAGGSGGALAGMISKAGPAVAAAAVAVGLLAGAALLKGAQSALEAGKAGDRMAAALGVDPAEQARLGAVAGRLYAGAYGESFGEVTDAIDAVKSSISGLADDAAVERATTKALDWATAFRIDVSQAAMYAGTLIKSGLAKDATQAFDLMTRAAQKVPASLREEVFEASTEYGQFFAQLGLDGPKAFDLLTRGAAKGQYGIDKAGDAIKEFTILSTDMSTASVASYKAIGLDAETMSNKILAGGETASKAFDQIVKGLLAIEDPTKRANAAIGLFGTPLEDLSTAQIPDFLRSMSGLGTSFADAEGAAVKMGDTLNDNAATKIESFKRRAAGAITELAGTFIEEAEKVTESESFQEWASQLSTDLEEIYAKHLPALREEWTKLSEALGDNKEEIGVLMKFTAELLLTSIAITATWGRIFTETMGAAQRHFRTVTMIFVDHLGMVLTAASKAFGWVPGLGGKLRTAEAEFKKFRDRVNGYLGGIEDEEVRVNVRYFEYGGEKKAGGTATKYAHGGVVGSAATGGVRSDFTMVGEAGPELLKLPPGSQVMSNPDTQRMTGGQGGGWGGPMQLIISGGTGGPGITGALLEWFHTALRTAQLSIGVRAADGTYTKVEVV